MIALCQQCAHPKKNGSREPEVIWMCASPQVGLCHIQELWLWHGGACAGNKTDKSETIASSHGRNYYNLEHWKWICKVSTGIHRQAMVGAMGFLTFKEIWNDSKTRTSCTYWSPPYPGKSVLKSKGGSIWISNIWKYLAWLTLQECKQFSWF